MIRPALRAGDSIVNSILNKQKQTLQWWEADINRVSMGIHHEGSAVKVEYTFKVSGVGISPVSRSDGFPQGSHIWHEG